MMTTATASGAPPSAHAIPETLTLLRAAPLPAGGVLSAYLPVRPFQVAGQAYLVRFREACKDIRNALTDAARDERHTFEAAAARIETFLAEDFAPRHPGVAVFSAMETDYFHVVPLPARPVPAVAWDTAPLLGPLEEALDEHERIAVVLTDRRTARLFSIFLGEIEATEIVESNDPGKRTVAGWGGNYSRHYQHHVQGHIRRTAHAAVELLHRYPFDRLLLGGPDDARNLLQQSLPRPLRARLAGVLPVSLTAGDAEVLAAALAAAEQIERRVEVEMVDELIAAATTPRVALGLRPVFDALSGDRVHQLFIADAFAGEGGECSTCGRLVAGLDRAPG